MKKVTFKHATNVSLTEYPREEGTSLVLVVEAALTPPLAEKMRCLEPLYRNVQTDGTKPEQWVPRQFEGSYGLPARIEGADVMLGDLSMRANLIHKLRVARPADAAENDTSLAIRMRLHFDGKQRDICDWFHNTNKAEYTLKINSLQAELNFDVRPSEEDESGEDAEDSKEAQEENLDMENGDGQEEPSPSTLASARTAAGGTPGRSKKAQALDAELDRQAARGEL
jgi:hypothetical protein